MSAPTADADGRGDYVLKRVAGRLELCANGARSGVCLQIDDVRRRIRQGGRLALAKACGIHNGPVILDAMAGWGTDGITLAALGARVVMVERDPLLFALLEDAVAQARVELCLAGTIETRHGDVRSAIVADERFDTIYLDPMFPSRHKHALPRKSAQLLSALLGGPVDDLSDLIVHAQPRARSRVVVKRRRHDAVLRTPQWHIRGRSVRFDVYRGTAPAAIG
jgi:16S rRNA (guanine1516-N2)-methyltransferase